MKDEELLKKLGKNIAKLRKDRKISQVELAYRCDFEKPNMRRIEAGMTNPTTLTLSKISKALSVSIKDLFDF